MSTTELQVLPGFKPATFKFEPGRNEVILASENPKIRDYPEELKNANIAITVAKLLVLLAVKNADINETNAMHRLIGRSMGRWTFQEIELAFDMYLAGRLPDTNGEVMVPRQNLNAVVLSQVMSGYQAWKAADIKMKKYQAQKKLMLQQTNEPSKEQKASLFKKLVWETWRQYDTEGTMRMGSHEVYDHFVELGILDPELFGYEEYVKPVYVAKVQTGGMAGATRGVIPTDNTVKAKKIALRKFLETFNSEEDFVFCMNESYKDPEND